jgi:hypothetical protein
MDVSTLIMWMVQATAARMGRDYSFTRDYQAVAPPPEPEKETWWPWEHVWYWLIRPADWPYFEYMNRYAV